MKQTKRDSNAMTVAFLKKVNFLAGNVEKLIPAMPDPLDPRRRMINPTYHDFLGMYDVIGLRPDHGTILIQSTTTNRRTKKLRELPKKEGFLFSLKSARVQVWAWRMVKGAPNGQQWALLVKEAFLRADDTVIFREVPPPSLEMFTGYDHFLPSRASYDASGCNLDKGYAELF
jgi:hypothetical protein